MRSFGGGRTDVRTYRRLEIHPCVLQEIGPLGLLPKKEIKENKEKDGEITEKKEEEEGEEEEIKKKKEEEKGEDDKDMEKGSQEKKYVFVT